MVRASFGRLLACVLIFSLFALLFPAATCAQTEDIAQPQQQAQRLFKERKYDEAHAAAERALQLAERGKNTESIANSLGELAWYALAVRLPEKALAASEQSLKLAPQLLWLEVNHAHALLFLGRTEDARTIYLGHKGEPIDAQRKWEVGIAQDFQELRSHGLDHPEMAAIEAILANAADSPRAQLDALRQQVAQFYKEEKNDEAASTAEKALALAERMLGLEHPYTLAWVNDLAMMYRALGRLGEAEPLFKRALTGYEKTLGPQHPSTLVSVDNLAEFYRAQRRYREAEPFLKQALAGREQALGPEHSSTLLSVHKLGALYRAQGRYAEAEPLYKRAVAGFEKALGPEHPDTLASVGNLAGLYQAQGRYSEAEPLLKQALADKEKAMGPEHPETLLSVNNLAELYRVQGRYDRAEPLYKRALAGLEQALGPEHGDTLSSVNNLATLYEAQGRYDDAEPLYKRALAGREKTLGPQHPSTLFIVNNLAALYFSRGHHIEAEPLMKRALAGFEQTLGREHPDTLTSVNNLGSLYDAQGRYGEAEPLYKRALAGREQALGPEHPDTLTTVSNLSLLYLAQGRYGEAEPPLKRALEGTEKALGPEHPATLLNVNNLGGLYREQHRYSEAEPLYKRALAGTEKALGSEHPLTLLSVNNLGGLYREQGRYGEAEPLHKRALEGTAKALGPEHPSTLVSFDNLAALYDMQGRYSEAEPLYKQALAGFEKALGPEHPNTLRNVSNMATFYFAQRDWQKAYQYWQRSTAAIAKRVQRGVLDAGLIGKTKSEVQRNDKQFWALVKAAYRLAPDGGMPWDAKMFETAQWALSSDAAQSLAQMAARGTTGDPALAALVRERQDVVDEWQTREKMQAAALGEVRAKRDPKVEAENRERMASIERRIAEIDVELKDKFPGYAALASPAPLAVPDVQALLGVDEALVLFLDTPDVKPTPEETFIWVITKTDTRWVHSDAGKAALTREVAALRCGLDHTAWEGLRCKELTGAERIHPLAFDHSRAFRLYQQLFGQVEDLIKDKKHLLLVPSGALTQLPFQVLITASPVKDDNRSAAWLTRRHALTVLPAVSSLKALRRTSRPSAAAEQLIGFGNPLLDGPDDSYAKSARLAREKQSCPKTLSQRVAAVFGLRGGSSVPDMRGGLANASFIRQLAPLPETADELCAVARDVGADGGDMYLGARATEREVKAMSARGKLANYRIVHFATHGAMAGQLSTTAEPGLILTPPKDASTEDDGYLSASEVAALKLNAEWVILSACNTAAGNAPNAEALSGLARAFIYAQARALLVSHWEVYSDATVKLITAAMREMARDKTVGRAEALRRAMLALIDKGRPHESHPAYWAPFIVVGEGAR